MEYKFYYAFSVVLYDLIPEMIEDFFFILGYMLTKMKKKKKRHDTVSKHILVFLTKINIPSLNLPSNLEL